MNKLPGEKIKILQPSWNSSMCSLPCCALKTGKTCITPAYLEVGEDKQPLGTVGESLEMNFCQRCLPYNDQKKKKKMKASNMKKAKER